MAVKAHKFFQWCQEHQDERGWVNITIKRSQKGTIYADLDTWKPEKKTDYETQADKQFEQVAQTLTDEQKANMTVDEVADLSDVPF